MRAPPRRRAGLREPVAGLRRRRRDGGGPGKRAGLEEAMGAAPAGPRGAPTAIAEPGAAGSRGETLPSEPPRFSDQPFDPRRGHRRHAFTQQALAAACGAREWDLGKDRPEAPLAAEGWGQVRWKRRGASVMEQRRVQQGGREGTGGRPRNGGSACPRTPPLGCAGDRSSLASSCVCLPTLTRCPNPFSPKLLRVRVCCLQTRKCNAF